MAFHSTFSHALRANRWRFGENAVDFSSRSRIFHQLRLAQANQIAKLHPLLIETARGALKARYRLSLAPMGRPQYFEYAVLNPQGNLFAVANGVIGYKGLNSASRGDVLMTTSREQINGQYDYYTGIRTSLTLSAGSSSLLCEWENATRANPSSAIIYDRAFQYPNELCRITGQSRDEELAGVVPKHRVLRDNQLLMEIYPEGRWTLSPWSFWERLACDTISVIFYFEPLVGLIRKSPELALRIILISLCSCRALSWPMSPSDGNLGDI